MSSSPKRTSGNPATQAKIDLTVKQQREQKRQEKLAEYQRQLAKRRRSKAVWWTVGSVATLVVVALIVASVVLTPRPVEIARGDGDGTGISGLETFENTANHVEGTVDYAQNPPAGGDHNAVWLNCGVYTEPQQNENAVHALEHGAVWITYDAAQVDDAELATLKAQLPSSYIVLSPYDGLDSPIVLSAWNAQVKVDSADDERIGEFLAAYWRSTSAPEPNAACTGGIDGPGKVS
ncbi:DUF3105 domain-containing protein [Microbacterium fluvii]|uniref:DUF3105 domain-containing protein n=1 Tax=Microbacterium fluvii TaxID=415215 RepID=A0ABW2HC35_9MICO|nr:DUF3105 domain-containing protein [Microbacterium fluvii]MCU4671630.1 DUF3105 domain-containing protein [Microbacterium fluvii]